MHKLEYNQQLVTLLCETAWRLGAVSREGWICGDVYSPEHLQPRSLHRPHSSSTQVLINSNMPLRYHVWPWLIFMPSRFFFLGVCPSFTSSISWALHSSNAPCAGSRCWRWSTGPRGKNHVTGISPIRFDPKPRAARPAVAYAKQVSPF